MLRRCLLSLTCALTLVAKPSRAQDAIYINGKFVTLNPAAAIVQAVGVREGRIIAVGTAGEVRRQVAADTRTIDMGGRTVIPGFYDNHVHLGEDLQEWKGGMIGAVPEWLDGVETIPALQEALRKRAAQTPPNEWIRGSLSREIWPNQKVPTRWQLDSAAPNHAVALVRGPHTLLLNSKALALAKFTRDTPNPPGGWIIRDSRGEPNGRVLEAARRIVEQVAPRRGESRGAGGVDATIARYRKFLGHMAALGITSLNVAGVGPADLRVLQEMYERHGPELPRMTVQIRLSPGHDTYDDTELGIRESIALMEGLGMRTGFGNERLKVGAIKMSIDGGLSAPVFWSVKEYKGRPGFHGAQRIPNEAFYRVAKRAHELGWQLGIRTMGDAAAAMVVDELDKILKERPRTDHRHYLHHVAVLPPNATLEKMQKNGIMVASQPGFLVALGAYAEEALDAEQEATQNPSKSLVNRGIRVSYGSDGGPFGPLVGIYAAVTRRGWDDKVRGPSEAVSVTDALRMHTVESAYFTFDEKTRGTIEPGKVADFTVLSEDILTIDPVRIREIRVERTLVGGREIYRAQTGATRTP